MGYKSGGWTNSSIDVIGGYSQNGTNYCYLTNSGGGEIQQSGSYVLTHFMATVNYTTT